MTLTLHQAERSDAFSIIDDMRDADYEEWSVGLGGFKVVTSLAHIAEWGTLARSVRNDEGVCIAMWGCNTSGEAWMVASNEAVRRVYSMHRLFEFGIAEMHQVSSSLSAYAYYRNFVHHKWMVRMGFKYAGEVRIINPKPGVTEGIFLKFTREAKG